MVRVLIVDDSAFMRRLLTDLLAASGQLEVVGTARNGEDAVQKNQRLRPDVITLDVEMPVMDGLAALDQILSTRPVPVVMFSSLTQAGAKTTLEALSKGAVDFLGKPESPKQLHDPLLRAMVVEKILSASAVDLSKLIPSPAMQLQPQPVPIVSRLRTPQIGAPTLVGIGTSTGGPRALQQVIPGLPADGGTAYLVVQHMPPGFTRSLAERLNGMSELTVLEAEDGALVEANHAYIAPGGQHLTVAQSGGRLSLQLQRTAAVNGHRPSVDVLFSSLAELPTYCGAAALLTGMGTDGAQGLYQLRQAGVYTIAEDSSTAVIYGMPRAAVALGAAIKVAPLPEVSSAILYGLAVGKER